MLNINFKGNNSLVNIWEILIRILNIKQFWKLNNTSKINKMKCSIIKTNSLLKFLFL
jgi:hypothetical protein